MLWVEVVGLWVWKYSSSTCVNMHVTSINQLSPEAGQGSGEWTKAVGAVGGLATG